MILNGDRDELSTYVRDVADRMGLCAWHIDLSTPDRVEIDNHVSQGVVDGMASCQVSHGSQHARIQIDNGWPEWEPEILRETVAHELLHCHTAKMLWAFQNVNAMLGDGALFSAIENAYDDAHEMTVDAIARVWAESLPMPIKEQEDVTPERVRAIQEIDHGTFNGKRYVTQIAGDASNEYDDFEVRSLNLSEVRG